MIRIAWFELRERLRDYPFYVTAGLLFVYWFSAALRLGYDPNFWGLYGEVHYNAPLVMYFLLAAQSFVVLACAPVFVGNALLRELEQQTAEVLCALPLRTRALFWGRFLGSCAALVLCALLGSSAIALAPLAAKLLGTVEPERVAALPLAQLLVAWALLLVPTVCAAAGFVFALAALARRSAAALAGTVALVLAAALAHQLGSLVHGPWLELVDVTGFHAVHRATQYWSAEQRNADFLPLSAGLLLNRALWLGLAALALGAAAARFTPGRFALGAGAAARTRRAPQAAASSAPAALTSAWPVRAPAARSPGWRRLLHQARWELARIYREPLLLAVLALCFAWALAQDLASLRLGFERALPETWRMTEARRGLWMLTFIIVPFTVVSALFRERIARAAELIDATSASDAVLYGGKLAAVAVFAGSAPLLVLLAGLTSQLAHGFREFDWARYAWELLGVYYPYQLQLALFAFGLGAFASGRAMSLGLVMLALYSSVFAHEAGLAEHALWLQAYELHEQPSGFSAPGAQLARTAAYHVYWLALAGLVVWAGTRCWPRGTPDGVRRRWVQARARLSVLPAAAGIALLAAAGGAAAWILYNENALGGYRSQEQRLAAAASYEQRYRAREPVPPPELRRVELRAALHPEQRRAQLDARLELLNASSVPLRELPLELPEHVALAALASAGIELERLTHDPAQRRSLYRLPEPLPPGGRIELELQLHAQLRGFAAGDANALRLEPAGAWLPAALLPRFGYDRTRELEVPRERARVGLGERVPELPPAAAADAAPPAPLATWDIWIETGAEQRALAPGRLESEHVSGERRTVHYRSEAVAAPELALFAARYEVQRGRWQAADGSEVALAVYALPEHRAGAAHFLESARRALDFLAPQLGAYPYSELRIAEVPRGAAPPEAAPNLVLVPEDQGWASDSRDSRGPHAAQYAVARQLAAHWWQQRLLPARVQGRGLLARGVPEYLALRSLERDFGAELIEQKYLPRALHRYFWYHGLHGRHEPALLRSAGNPYVDEVKAGLALRAISQRLGPAQLDALLAAYLRERAPAAAPLAAAAPAALALELGSALQAAAPADARAPLDELLGEVVHYDNRLLGAAAQPLPGGGYRLRLSLAAARIRADAPPGSPAHAESSSFPLEVGVTLRGAAGGAQREQLETIRVRGPRETVELRLDAEPLAVELDPRRLLLDAERANDALRVAAAGSGG